MVLAFYTVTPLQFLCSRRCYDHPGKTASWQDLAPQIIERISSHPHELLLVNEQGHSPLYTLCDQGAPEHILNLLLDSNAPLTLQQKTKNGSLVIHKMRSKDYPLKTRLRVADLYPKSVDVPCPWTKIAPITTAELVREKRYELVVTFCAVFKKEDRALHTHTGFFNRGENRRGKEIEDNTLRFVYMVCCHFGADCVSLGQTYRKPKSSRDQYMSYSFRNDINNIIMGYVGAYW